MKEYTIEIIVQNHSDELKRSVTQFVEANNTKEAIEKVGKNL